MFGMAIGAPILYGLMGFLGGIIMAAFYNLFAGWFGGPEIEESVGKNEKALRRDSFFSRFAGTQVLPRERYARATV